MVEMYSVERPTNMEPLSHRVRKEEDLYVLSNGPLKMATPYLLSYISVHSLSRVCYPVYLLWILVLWYLFWILQAVEGRACVKEIALMANTVHL